MNRYSSTAVRSAWLLVLALTAFPAHALRVGELGHLHGIAFDPGSSESLLVATHYGLYRARPDGAAVLIGERRDDLIALAVDPADANALYALGHARNGSQVALMHSDNGGTNWTLRAQKLGSPDDYHQLAVSPADPALLYGVHGTLQASTNSGRAWESIGPTPNKLIALAGSAADAGKLYAATQSGLLVSPDSGREWQRESAFRAPVSLVHVAADGTKYAFVLGRGLMRSAPDEQAWEALYNGFGGHYPLRLAIDPDDPEHLGLLTHAGGLFTSVDGGKSWERFPRPPIRSGSVAAAGERLYGEYCAACHGVAGVGETPGSANAPADRSQLAPALDFSAHAWHHDDAQLVETILDGGIARGGRMPAWKSLLSRDNARELVAYMKTLWRARERACQGARHMSCDWVPASRPQ